MGSAMTEEKKPRLFFGWFVLGAAFFIATVAYSMRYSFSVFYPEILNEFGWSRADTAGAFSVNLLVYGIISPFVGILADRFGPRKVLVFGSVVLAVGLLALSQLHSIWQFYLLFGFIMAVGINASGFAVHYSYLPNWFILRRGLAFGVITAASGANNILASLYQRIISSIGWRSAYGVLAAIVVVAILPLVAFVIRRTPQDKGQLPDGVAGNLKGKGSNEAGYNRADLLIADKEWAATEWTLGRAFKANRFWFMFSSRFCFGFLVNLIMGHQPIYCQDVGFSAAFAAAVFGLSGFTLVVGNLCGFISDRIGREVTYTIGMVGIVIGIFILMTATASQPWLLYLYVIFWGLFLGVAGPAAFATQADLFSFGGRRYGAINGFFIFGYGIGGMIGPWLGGYIFDVSKSYDLAFIIVIIASIASCIFLWLAAPRKVRLVAGKAPKFAGG